MALGIKRRSIVDAPKNEKRNPMKMSVGMLDHYNVSTSKLNETVHFY